MFSGSWGKAILRRSARPILAGTLGLKRMGLVTLDGVYTTDS